MVAAIKAAETNPEASIVVLEKLGKPGHKVAASGNGRCNLSNTESPEWEKTSAFFSSIGLLTRIESQGRVYPYSEDGRDVVALLEKACQKRGVEILTRREVVSISPNKDHSPGFIINTEFNKPKAYRSGEVTIDQGILKGFIEDEPIRFFSKTLLIATGGKSKPKMGTTGDGYRFAKDLGHSIMPLIPVLTGVETVEDLSPLAGIRQKIRLTLNLAEEKEIQIFREDGEIQFADYGISGICVFDMTRFIHGRDYSKYKVEIDFVPEYSKDELKVLLENRDNICSIVKGPLAKMLLDDLSCEEMDGTNERAEILADRLKAFELNVKSFRGWDMAQVTRGGVPLSEIEEETGESLLVPGLYFSGEVLDVDFRCGGFNLQNAWSTGLRAGKSMGEITSK